MAGGPRKFSEKIALLNQKEAEANAAFCNIMEQVSRIRPGSGSQVDLAENSIETKNTNSLHSAIDEAIGFNEHVNITYEHQQFQAQQQQQIQSQLNLPKKLKHPKSKHQDSNMIHIKNELIQPIIHHNFNNQNGTGGGGGGGGGGGVLSSNLYLQLPNQTDSFRRAHSDSSIHNSHVNPNQIPNYQNNQHLQQQQQQSHHQQQLNFQNNSLHQHHHQQHQQQQQHDQIQHLNFQQQQHTYQQQHHQYSPVYPNNPSNIFDNSTTIPFKSHLTLPITPDGSNSTEKNKLNSPTSPVIPPPTSPISPKTTTNGIDVITSSSPTSPQNFLVNSFNLKQESANLNESNINFALTYNLPHLNVHSPQQPQSLNHHHHQNQHQQQQQQHYQHSTDQPNSNSKNENNNNNNNNNLLNPGSVQNMNGGSLPDLTSFQFQNNQMHTYQQLLEYNKRQQQQQPQQQQHHHQSNQNSYENSNSLLLQPNFQQHNYIGPVKTTHANSVSPTRGMSRYSPTGSNASLSSIANRRPSPQRNLPLGDLANINNHSTEQKSMPSSPHQIPPISSPLPSLEFTINSQQITSYLNGLQNGVLSTTTTSNQYRSIGGNGGGSLMHNGESLPPSPQSQQSSFNSPQGSPGPLSISPQDLNPFTIQNYDIMQKKFDSINLETKQKQHQQHQHQHHHQFNNNNSNNNILTSPPNSNGSLENNNNTNNNDNLKNTETIDHDTIDAFTLNNSRSASISSTSSSNGQLINDFNEIELQNLNSTNNNSNNSDLNHNHHHHHRNKSDTNNSNQKNSIPNVIITYSVDPCEEKNEFIKDLPNDLMYNEDLLIKNEHFDLDLQMLSDSPVQLDPNFSDDQILYQVS